MKSVNYLNRDFESLKLDLINYVKNYHQDKVKYFNPNSPDILYLELLAYIGDSLNFQIDKSFNESFRDTAQQRESLIRIANDLGFYNFYSKPSTTQLILSINVPAKPNTNGSSMVIDNQYLFGIYPGMVIESNNGTLFECLEEVNFSSPINRKVTPNFDTNGKLIDYTVEKSISVKAGQTRIQRYYISSANSKPFLEIFINDNEVTEVLGAVSVKGNSFELPADELFSINNENFFVEVQNLSENKVFLELTPQDPGVQDILNAYTDMTINYGDWINKPKRFITRRDKNNNTYLTFGSTLIDYTNWNNAVNNFSTSQITNFSLNQILNNSALGEIPEIDTTLFIKYRVGGGIGTNVINNSLTNIVQKQFILPLTITNFTILEQVKSSLIVSSNLPAIGGGSTLSNEELRYIVPKVFASNDRAVTYEDFKAIIFNMPSRFGIPFRISLEEIKPQLLNYTQVKNYISEQSRKISLSVSSTERELLIAEMNSWIENYPSQVLEETVSGTNVSLSEVSNSLNSSTNINDHKLWYGEKCRLYVLGIDEEQKPISITKKGVWQSPNEILKLNIKNYLKEKRLVGDWIDIVDANIVNFQIEFSIIADKKNKESVLFECLTKLREYFSIYNWQINQPIYKSNVNAILQEINGVLNVVDLKFYNIWGTDSATGREYSPIEMGRYRYIKPNTSLINNRYEMQDYNNIILSSPSVFLHCKYPDVDIIGKAIE